MFAFDANDFPVLRSPSSKPSNEKAQPQFSRDRAWQYGSANPATFATASLPVVRDITRTPPVRIASPSPARLAAQLQAVANAGVMGDKLNFDALRDKSARRKKKKRDGNAAAPAIHVIRGFQTPVTSGGEESDVSSSSTPRFGPRVGDHPSITGSPGLRPSSECGGISALRLKLDAINLQATPEKVTGLESMNALPSDLSSAGSATSEATSDSDDKTEVESYEIKLENDFVSPNAGTRTPLGTTGSMLRQNIFQRKMTASDFEPLSCLGKGTFGTVFLVKHTATGRLYAQKQFRKASLTVHKKLVEQTKTERTILESVNRHPFVVKLYYAFQDHEKLYLILEYAQGGELFHHLAMERMFPEEIAAFYMAEMVLALEHLHHNVGVVYRDLKPENCLLDSEGHLLLTDFGLSKVAVDPDDTCKSSVGTIDYMAPEVIAGSKYGMVVDWWSLGALGFDLLTGSPPFTANNHAKIQEKILRSKLILPYYLSPDAKDLLTRLLRKEPHKRLGYHMPKDLQTIKKHRFFRKIDWRKLEKRELDPPIKPLITDPELAENFANEFTGLPLSPVVLRRSVGGSTDTDGFAAGSDVNPFGGFSFVASQSLLECGDWGV